MAAKVLVADDEYTIRDLLRTILVDEGYQVLEASDGAEALELARTEKPDVILLDIKMPGINGIQVCRQLKHEQETRTIPVVMVTGLRHNRTEALEAGAEDFVCKPFDMEDILIRVRSVLHLRHLDADLDRALAT